MNTFPRDPRNKLTGFHFSYFGQTKPGHRAPIRNLRWAWVIALLCLSTICSPHLNASVDKQLQQQRYDYSIAKSKLQRGQFDAFQTVRSRLNDYPLTPYLDYGFASRQLKTLNKPVIESFIRTHKNTYLGDRLTRQYLYTLASQKHWEDLIYWYQPKLSNTATRCQWIEARTHTGDTSALKELKDIWLTGKSLPKACDTVLDLWGKSEFYNDALVWQRMLLALNNSKRSLARYLGNQLGSDYQNYVELIWRLDQHPHKIKKRQLFSSYTPEMQQVVAFGIRKYARKHPIEAFKLWERYEASIIFADEIVRDTKLALVSALIRKDHATEAKSLIAQSPSIQKPQLIERLIRVELKRQHWADVVSTISMLPPSHQETDRWRYWDLRAREELKWLTKSEARTKYRELAYERSFYGFLSADKTKQNYALNHEPSSYPESLLANLASRPELIRAKELWLTGHDSEARIEWHYGTQKLSARELAAAGRLAHNWGWYDQGINAMISGKHWNVLDVRFPLAYKEQVVQAAKNAKLDPTLVFAVARQESAMSERAVSSAGAKGLMQLMPSTARSTAIKRGLPHKTEDLYQAEHNLYLGSQYLQELIERFSGNRILATAAYNAGPHRVDRWASNAKDLPFDVWIETIPFRETRGYVQNVLTYNVIYAYRIGESRPLISKKEAKQKL